MREEERSVIGVMQPTVRKLHYINTLWCVYACVSVSVCVSLSVCVRVCVWCVFALLRGEGMTIQYMFGHNALRAHTITHTAC